MPIPTTFLDTCRARVILTPEYAAVGFAQLSFIVIPSSLVSTLA